MKARAVAAVALLGPVVVWAWLLADPTRDRQVILPNEHFLVVTIVAVLALLVALLVIRSALQIEQYQVLLIALGFMAVAGFFSVHALSTPGVLASVPSASGGSAAGAGGGYGTDYGSGYSASGYGAPTGHDHAVTYDYGETVVGVSAFLSLFIPSFFFAASYAPVALRIKRGLPVPAGGLALLVGLGLVGYGALAGWYTELVAGLPLARPPWSYAVASISVALLLFTAWHQAAVYRRTGFPVQFALAIAFVLLAEAQVLMVVSTFWSLSWWGYHVMMFAAVVAALGALFVELDRRRGLERFLPTEVVERVVAGNLVSLAGERRTATVLFADLRGSTAISEALPAERVVELLNEYVGTMARCVFEQGGMLDKFLGDGVMAVYGVVPDRSDGAEPAARTALGLRRAFGELNARRAAAGLPTVDFGVGIHTGEVVLGAIGVPQRQDFTAVGDPVNTASRLESLCKEYKVDVVLSHDAVDRLPSADFRLRELGTTPIRGKREPVQLYTLA